MTKLLGNMVGRLDRLPMLQRARAALSVVGVIVLAVLLPCWSQQVPPATATPGQPATQNPATVAAPGARRLTLVMALELADRQNLDIAAARLERSVALAGIRTAQEIPNPTTTATASRDLPHESLVFDLPIEIGGQRKGRINVANGEVAITDIEIATVSRQVRQQVRTAFYNVALAQGVTGERQKARDLAQRLYDIAQARFQAGDVPQLEAFQAQLEVSRADTELDVARSEEQVAASQLNALLNELSDASWDVGSAIEALPAPVVLPDLVQRATASNPELQHLAQEQKNEQAEHALLKRERIPDIVLEAGSDFNSCTATADPPCDFHEGARGGASVELPIFSRNQGELAQSEARQRALDGSVLATRRMVTGNVETAYYEFSARQREVMLNRMTLVPAAQRLEMLAEESYQSGKESILVVLNAQRDVQQLELDYLQSLFELHTAFAELEETVGVPLD